jgi:hypothetical protein
LGGSGEIGRRASGARWRTDCCCGDHDVVLRRPDIREARHQRCGGVAIGCFVLLGFVALMVLWPRRDWEFSLAPDQYIATYLEPAEGDPLALHLIERDLALHMGRSAELNRRQLRTLTGVFRVGAVLLVVEVLAWVVALVVQR